MSNYSKLSFAQVHVTLPPFPTAPGQPIYLGYVRTGANSISVQAMWPVRDANNLPLNGLVQGCAAVKEIPVSGVDPWANASPTDGGVDVFNAPIKGFVTLGPLDGGTTSWIPVSGVPEGKPISIKVACKS